MKVQILGTGCPKCKKLAELTDQAAKELGLQLAVASPDQDGVKPELSNSTNIFVRKDREFQVHLFPYNWKRSKELFDDAADEALGMELA